MNVKQPIKQSAKPFTSHSRKAEADYPCVLKFADATSIDELVKLPNSAASATRRGSPVARPFPETFRPGDNDVIFGRTLQASLHNGNVRFMDVVKSRLGSYLKAKTKSSKSAILQEVVDEVRTKGFFVRLEIETDRWWSVDETVAREKTSQLFRDALADRYRSSKASKRQIRIANLANKQDAKKIDTTRSASYLNFLNDASVIDGSASINYSSELSNYAFFTQNADQNLGQKKKPKIVFDSQLSKLCTADKAGCMLGPIIRHVSLDKCLSAPFPSVQGPLIAQISIPEVLSGAPLRSVSNAELTDFFSADELLEPTPVEKLPSKSADSQPLVKQFEDDAGQIVLKYLFDGLVEGQ